MKKVLLVFITVATLITTAPLTALAAPAVSSTPVQFAAQDNVKDYSALAAKWWIWGLSQPTSTNPLTDKTGAQCANQQTGDVWFLAGTFNTGGKEKRTCTVPAGTNLFFPVINVVDIEPQADHRTPAYVRKLVASVDVKNSASNLTVTFDGRAIGPDVVQYEESPIFSVTLPDDNIFGGASAGAPGGVYEPCADAGYYALIKNPLPGEHTLKFTGTLGDFSIDMTYKLTVSQ
ncbi:hypothetical protein ASG92_22925 [Arthrobacter sp. Soil736]|uniref:hypothetical protein n=1 Tax=Arthrobacter sp. Soil736 TaxID=1736395 RepID=UPI0006F83572|nr:hypothetical protein [Arthrobacter sp. Soil736]KRE58764.1 hypothetical protein ASG92_22925 [Arthrobacter sp. Soil736]